MKEVYVKIGLGIFVIWEIFYQYWIFKIHKIIFNFFSHI